MVSSHFSNSIQKKGDGYEVSLPGPEGHNILFVIYKLSRSRTHVYCSQLCRPLILRLSRIATSWHGCGPNGLTLTKSRPMLAHLTANHEGVESDWVSLWVPHTLLSAITVGHLLESLTMFNLMGGLGWAECHFSPAKLCSTRLSPSRTHAVYCACLATCLLTLVNDIINPI